MSVVATDAGLRAIAFFGGGTGGHLNPGLAVAECARERFPDVEIVFFGSGRAVESSVFAETPFKTESLDLTTPRGPRGWTRYLLQSRSAIRKIRPLLRDRFDAVVGLGGYASVPGIVAARREGIPVILLEQNQVPGRVNRWFAPRADAVSCPNAEVGARLSGRVEITGNPMRRSILRAAAERHQQGIAGRDVEEFELRKVVICGGSQGAHGLNRAVQSALLALGDFRHRIYFIHVAGKADKPQVESFYRNGGWNAEVHEFTPDLPKLLAGCDLALTRAGGTTLAELTALGVPSVLVPYPHHRDKHQLLNARLIESAGGGVVIEEDRLDANALRTVFEEVLFSPRTLLDMSLGSRSLGRLDSSDRVLDLILELRKPCPSAFASSY